MKTFRLVIAAALSACASAPPTPPAREPEPPASMPAPSVEASAPVATPAPEAAKPAPLFERLGGLPAINAVIDDFLARNLSDPRIKERFFNTDAALLKQRLVDFVCVATGGPCQYGGRDMDTAHGGMEVVDEEFNAIVENLVGTLDKFKVPERERNELLGALGPLKPHIVTPSDKLRPIDDKKLDAVIAMQSKMKDKQVADLLGLAAQAGKRGQRNYAEQLFTRAEMITGPQMLASIAGTFREGAPARIATPLKKMPDVAQPAVMPNEEVAAPPKAKVGMLHGQLQIGGKAPSGLGVIMLTPAKGTVKKRTPKERTIEQRGKEFAPHVMAVPVGSTVAFPNFDKVFHNVFSLSKSKAFDLGMYKNGEAREIKFDKPGIIRLGCNLHAAMSAYVIVVEAPHYAMVDKDGSFTFNALAPGKYKVQVWNESAGEPITSEVVVKEGDNAKDFDLTATPAGISPDKFGTPR